MAAWNARNWVNEYTRDYYGGALMLLLGVGAMVQGLRYDVGTLTDMGAGFFPVALGAILMFLGVAIAGSARRAQPREREEKLPPEWRGWLCIIASVLAFVVLGKYGGLLPATFAIVFIAAMGDRDNGIVSALLLAAGISVICVLVFWWALQLQFPLFSWG